MTPYQQKLSRLVDRLSSRTLDGSLTWEERDDRVQTRLATGIIEIKRDRDDSGQDAIRMSVFDRGGDLRLSFDDTALTYRDEEGNSWYAYSKMRELMEAAFRMARGEDQILNSLLSELSSGFDDGPS